MFTALITAALAQENTLHLSVHTGTNDDLVTERVTTIGIERVVRPWLSANLHAGMGPREGKRRPMALMVEQTTYLVSRSAAPRGIGWAGARFTPARRSVGRVDSALGLDLGAGALYSVEYGPLVNPSDFKEISAMARYGLYSSLNWNTWGIELGLSRTRYEESFNDSAGEDFLFSTQRLWVSGGITWRL
jgi:hypothetical protein